MKLYILVFYSDGANRISHLKRSLFELYHVLIVHTCPFGEDQQPVSRLPSNYFLNSIKRRVKSKERSHRDGNKHVMRCIARQMTNNSSNKNDDNNNNNNDNDNERKQYIDINPSLNQAHMAETPHTKLTFGKPPSCPWTSHG